MDIDHNSTLTDESFLSSDPQVKHNFIQSIFSSTKCYDIMQNSSKGTIFETTIPFQLAFFALAEHDTDVAPLWDPEKRAFVGLFTAIDYIQSLRIWLNQNLQCSDLSSRTIFEMIRAFPYIFKHSGFQAIDAEDSVLQMCLLLLRTNNDYVPVIDADNGNLVSILGFLDIVNLLSQASNQYPQLFNQSIQDANIGTFQNIITVSKNTKLKDILDILETNKGGDISGVPVLDESNKVVGYYHRSDISFIIKAADTESILSNLINFQVDQSMELREQLLQSGALMSSFQGLVLCTMKDLLSTTLHAMVRARSCRAVIVDDSKSMMCIGIITIKDIIRFYIDK